jgi:hypothetical protein
MYTGFGRRNSGEEVIVTSKCRWKDNIRAGLKNRVKGHGLDIETSGRLF